MVGRRSILAVLVVVVVAAVFVVGLVQAGGPAPGPARSDPGPSLARARARVAGAPAPLARLYARGDAVLDLDRAGQTRLLDRLHGYPVVVNVWGSWCGPCRDEFPLLRRAAAEHGRRVAFLGVDVRDTRSRAAGFLRRQPTVYPHLFDPRGALAVRLGADADFVPSTAYLDRRGRICAVHRGPYVRAADLARDLRRYTAPGACRAR